MSSGKGLRGFQPSESVTSDHPDRPLRKSATTADSAFPQGFASSRLPESLNQPLTILQSASHLFCQMMPNLQMSSLDPGLSNAQLLAGALTSVQNLSNPSIQNAQSPLLEGLQSASLLSQYGIQMPLFPMRPPSQTQGLTPADPTSQLTQAFSMPLVATLMQQLLCSSLGAAAAPSLPMNNSNFVVQLMAQLLTTQLTQPPQPASPSALAGFMQMMQVFSSIMGSSQTTTTSNAKPHASIMTLLPTLDAATAKEVILVLMKQLIQSGNLTDDSISKQFLKKLQSNSTSHMAASWDMSDNEQNMPIDPKNIKREIILPLGDFDAGFSSVPGTPLHNEQVDSETTASVISDDVESNSRHLNMQNNKQTNSDKTNLSAESTEDVMKHSGKQLSKKSLKRRRRTSYNLLVSDFDDHPENDLKDSEIQDMNQGTDLAGEFHTARSRLRSRHRTVTYEEYDRDDVDDSESNMYKKSKKKCSVKKSTQSGRVVGEISMKESMLMTTEINQSVNSSKSDLPKVINSEKDGSSASLHTVANVKTEMSESVIILPNINSCQSPEVRYLYMGRKNEGMDWLNLIAYKSDDGDSSSTNQCLFCPMICTDVKVVADHIITKHTDLGFVLSNLKQPNGRVIFLACRHCSYVTFESMLMWIHFEMYHGVVGIMDGSSLPRMRVDKPIDVTVVSLDSAVNSEQCRIAYVCLDCLLCARDGYKVAQHVLQAHPNTANFNGCFVKVMMIKPRVNDCFTYRDALFEDEHTNALKDSYFCMLCDYATSTAFLAMSHNLQMHQQKRLLFVCSECDHQCLHKSNLTTHMLRCHDYAGIASFMCSTTLVYSLPGDMLSECEIPVKHKSLDVTSSCGKRKCEKKCPDSIIQSTTVSSSQKKCRILKKTEENDSNEMLLSDAKDKSINS